MNGDFEGLKSKQTECRNELKSERRISRKEINFAHDMNKNSAEILLRLERAHTHTQTHTHTHKGQSQMKHEGALSLHANQDKQPLL